MKLAALALVAVSTPAIAGVEVAVDPAAPFSATELADAVRLRWRGDGDVTVQVAKRGDDEIVIHVGQRSQKVRVANDDRAASTRVVAIVILSMLDEPPSATPQLDDELPPVFEPAPPAPTTPAKRPWGVQLGGRLAESDDGFKSLLVTGGVAIPLAPHVRASGMIGLGHSTYRNNTTMLPMRVGLEAAAGAAALELGGQVATSRVASCGGGRWGAASGVYGAAKAFLPLSDGKRMILEVGFDYVLANNRTACNAPLDHLDYGGWLGVGVEWDR